MVVPIYFLKFHKIFHARSEIKMAKTRKAEAIGTVTGTVPGAVIGGLFGNKVGTEQ